ncbi:MAG: DNA polymerase III subunit delta [Saprospiraceae bacterium]|nr:DNA polymerase III subunit delta [Saprospiraceae bacterium]
MTFEEILKSIRSGKHQPVYFLFGEEPYFIDQVAHVLESEVLNESEKAFNQLVLYGKDTQIGSIIDEARQFPMMSDKKVLIIKEAQELKGWDDLISYLEKPAPHTILVFCHKYKKPDKRTKFYKALEKSALVFESKPLYENQIAAWVTQYIRSKGFTIDSAAADLVTDYVGSDLSKITNELGKICIGLPSGGKITRDLIADQVGVIKEFNVFELSNAFGEKNFSKAALIIDYFAQANKSGFLIPMVAQLHSFFYKVLIASTHFKESDPVLAKMLGISTVYFVKDYRTAAKNYSRDSIKNILRSLMEADMKGKGIGSRDDDAALSKEILLAIFYEQELTMAKKMAIY